MDLRRIPPSALACTILGLALPTPAVAGLDYRATLLPAQGELAVNVCSNRDRALLRLRDASGVASRHARADPPPESSSVYQVDIRARDGLRAGSLHQGECVGYRINLTATLADGGRELGRRLPNGDWLLAPAVWLWRPEPAEPIRLRIDLPDGLHDSLPWPRDADGWIHPGSSGKGWSSWTAFGRLPSREIRRPGGTLRASVVGVTTPEQARTLLTAVEDGANILLTAYGRLPLVDAQVLLLTHGGGGPALPFGETLRGERPSVLLHVRADASAAELRDDWTLAHELSHLMHPYLGASGRWLAEGVASYFQNVLRARAGVIDPDDGWSRLLAGFARGRADRRDQPLAEVSRNLDRNHAYMRAYWSGAALMLQADLALRRRGQSLDAVLDRFAACCLADQPRWDADRFVDRLDRLAGWPVFRPLFERYASSREFPALDATLSELGLGWNAGRMRLDDSAESASLRQAIMSGHVPAGVDRDISRPRVSSPRAGE